MSFYICQNCYERILDAGLEGEEWTTSIPTVIEKCVICETPFRVNRDGNGLVPRCHCMTGHFGPRSKREIMGKPVRVVESLDVPEGEVVLTDFHDWVKVKVAKGCPMTEADLQKIRDEWKAKYAGS